MISLEKRMLGKLLDSYENSKLMRGENLVHIQITYAFTKRNVPEYFDESSTAYEGIHATVKEMERDGLIRILWKNNKTDHIIEKVILQEDAIPRVYEILKRIPKVDQEQRILELLSRLIVEVKSPVTEKFLRRMSERISQGKTVKEYLDIANPVESERLVRAIDLVVSNEEECFLREFSIRHFHDSKCFEALEPKVCKILREELPQYETLENEELLSEYQIYHTPSYVYIKGNICL